MKDISTKGVQILKEDKERNLKPNKEIAMAQKIMVNWGKDKIQKVYIKDTEAKKLRKQKKEDSQTQEKEGILY